jgi:cyclophilin family peptidyl-prolyl cis-trans isomerase
MQGKHIGIIIGTIAFLGAMYYFTSVGPSDTQAALPPQQTSAEEYAAAATTSTQVQPATPEKAVPQPSSTTNKKIMKATMKTSQGTIVLELNAADAPNTVANFTKLAKEGFYNGVKFHRVIAGFMIQGGDPLTKDDAQAGLWGTGGPGYKFADEIHKNNKNNVGTISMANAGPNTNGSQFFINVNNNNFLDGKHTVFGTVVEGMDVVKAIESVQVGPQDRPVTPVVIESVTVAE